MNSNYNALQGYNVVTSNSYINSPRTRRVIEVTLDEEFEIPQYGFFVLQLLVEEDAHYTLSLVQLAVNVPAATQKGSFNLGVFPDAKVLSCSRIPKGVDKYTFYIWENAIVCDVSRSSYDTYEGMLWQQ